MSPVLSARLGRNDQEELVHLNDTDGAVEATLLFVDQVGSTRLVAERGDAAMVPIRQRLWSLFIASVAEHGGRILSDEGDGGSALFHDPAAAADAGLALLEQTRTDPDLVLRAGLNTGPVIATHTGMVGLAIHLAARVCDAAPAHHLLATAASADALRSSDSLRVDPLGVRRMKGLEDPVALCLITDRSAPPPSVDDVGQMRSSPLLEEAVDAASFIGRSAEAVRLHQLLRTSDGGGGVVAIAGEAGSGKTALAYHVAREFDAEGMLWLIGRSDETFADPFHEVTEMLRGAVLALPVEVLLDHVNRHGPIVTRLIPEIAELLGMARPSATEILPEKQQLFEAVGDLIAIIARARPVVLMLEDLHWTTTQTLELFRHLLRSDGLAGVSLLVTLRPNEIEPYSEVAELLAWLASEHQTQTVDLAPLGLDDVVELCHSLVDGATDGVVDALARHLVDQTGGNALFCVEMLRSVQAEPALRSSVEVDVGSLVVVPSTVQELVVSRVQKLGRATAGVLADASVLGETFDLVDLREMSTLDVLDALDHAERSGIVRSDDADGTTFTFGHAIVQQALYRHQTTAARLRRHRAAADALASTSTRRRARAIDRLRHLQNAGPLARAIEVVDAASLAAEIAAEKLALSTAVTFRQVAVDALEDAPDRERAIALAGLGRAQTAVLLQAGKATMVSAAAAAEAAGDWDLHADIAIDYGGDLKENQATVDVAEPVSLITRSLEHHVGKTARRARLLSALAVWQRQFLPCVERVAYLDEALAIARSLDDEGVLASILSQRHRALHGPNVAVEALGIADELMTIAASLGSDALAFQSLYLRAIVALELGSWEAANEAATAMVEVGGRLQNIEGRRVTAMWLSLTAQIEGRWRDASSHVDELLRILADYPQPELERFVAAVSFVPLWFEHGATLLHSLSGTTGGRHSTRAWFAAEAGFHDVARSWIAEAPTPDQLVRNMDYMWWHDVVSLTRAASALGDRALAADLYRVMLPYRDRIAMMGFAAFLGSAEHHLGTLSATLGERSRARDHFSRAAERHQAMGAVPFSELTARELDALS